MTDEVKNCFINIKADIEDLYCIGIGKEVEIHNKTLDEVWGILAKHYKELENCAN